MVKLRFWNFKSMSWVEADNGVNTFLKEHFHFSIMSNTSNVAMSIRTYQSVLLTEKYILYDEHSPLRTSNAIVELDELQ